MKRLGSSTGERVAAGFLEEALCDESKYERDASSILKGSVPMILLTTAEHHALLARSVRVAVVGASPRSTRASYDVFHYLSTHGLIDVAPINSAVSAIDGIEAFPTLRAYARVWGVPDLVTVLRNPADPKKVAAQAIEIGAKAIWFQLGVASDEAIELADRAGLDVVAERCIEVELRQLAEASSAGRSR